MGTFLKITAAILVGVLALVVSLWFWLKLPAAPDVAAAKPLPVGFIWGVSSSAVQSEGGSVDSAVLRLNRKAVSAAENPEDPLGHSVDFRHRYRDDIALAHDLGVNTFRLGVSWARVEPRKGQIDTRELAYYDDVIRALKDAGIRPLITLEHFDQPGWIADQGGWGNPRTVDDFLAYVQLIVERYDPDVRWWLSFNETSLYMIAAAARAGHGLGGAAKIRHNLIDAHRRSYELIHSLQPDAMVSSNIAWAGDTFASRLVEKLLDWAFLDQIADRIDYIGLDYYTSDISGLAGKDWDWRQEPAGLYRALHELSRHYPRLPLLVTENGMATDNAAPRRDGVRREDALRDSVYWVQRARADGIDVVGYMVWSLTDNFEWGSYSPRFGLYTVNVLTDPALTRIPTAAVPVYRQIIANAGVAPAYRPVVDP